MDESGDVLPPRSDTPSTRSGHPPGTPKPPIDPPRRRSSLHFSRAFSCSPPQVIDEDAESVDLPASRKVDMIESNNVNQTPSNVGRRRAPISASANVTPGHVAQMQKLFQSAKASLRMDMAFAASPTGSIGSRLPPTNASPDLEWEDREEEDAQINRAWRYSTAPGILLGFARDVREPVPGASPALPPLPTHDPLESDNEPLSSGFNSPNLPLALPVAAATFDLGSSPPIADVASPLKSTAPSVVELQGQLTALRVADEERQEMDLDESPLVARVQRLSAGPQRLQEQLIADISEDSMVSEPSDGEIFLSEPAKAAAESAKEKRGILRTLFQFRRPSHEAVTPEPAKELEAQVRRIETPCPDPELHELFSKSVCPDPMAHITPHYHHGPTETPPEAIMSGSHRYSAYAGPSEPYHAPLQPPMPLYQRASSTGSPVAFPKFKSPPPSPRRMSLPFQDSPRYGPQPRKKPSYTHMAGEHFQPGWYYTQNRSQELNINEYSFSTAAAKSIGRSAAPDLLIRDSYRTDTLTPLARPIGKYRKTGITAMASSRGVSKYYGDAGGRPSGHPTRMGTKRPRGRSDVRFRSSPPPQPVDMASELKRPRPQDLEDNIYHDDDSPVLDEDTRAAIRFSLLATATPGSQQMRQGLRELSPNVMMARGDRRVRKKRRPSYWDGDLKEVQNSPAGRALNGKRVVRGSFREGAERKVVASPPKDGVGSVRSERVEIEGGSEESGSMGVEVDGRRGSGSGSGKLAIEEVDGTMMQIEKEME